MSSFFPSTIDLSASAIQVVQTSRQNPRVAMDKNGLRAYDASGNLLFNLDASSGSAILSGTVSAHGFKFYDPIHGFVYQLSSARPVSSQPYWSILGPLWSDIKALNLTYAQVKALASQGWDNFRKYLVQQRGI